MSAASAAKLYDAGKGSSRNASPMASSRLGRGAQVDWKTLVHHLGLALGGRPAASFARRPMLPVIAKELQAGGLVLTSAEPPNGIGSVLTRRFQQVGDVVKVGRGIWGLKEWYPNRTFKPENKAAKLISEAAESAVSGQDAASSSPEAPTEMFDDADESK